MLKKAWIILKNAGLLFVEHNVTRMSAALSFYTFFALAPVLLIVIFSTGLLFGNNAIEQSLFRQLDAFIGHETTVQIQQLIQNSHKLNFTSLASVVSIIAIVFSATGVFTEIQSSLNSIWHLKAKASKGWLKYLINRFLSLSVIIGLGFILLVSLIISTLVDVVLHKIAQRTDMSVIYLSNFINITFSTLIIACIFAIIFKFLPDAKITYKHIAVPSVLTAILFMSGKFLIGYYISSLNPTQPFGAASSLVVILLWVYYSSMILYFGACFAKAYAQQMGRHIYPNDYAVFVEQVEIQNKNALQEQPNIVS